MNEAAAPKKPARRSVCARVARHEILHQEGVAGLWTRFPRWLRRTPGVRVRLDLHGRVHVKTTIVVRYGCNAREVGEQVQEAIRTAIERTSDRAIGRIRVTIAGTTPPRQVA